MRRWLVALVSAVIASAVGVSVNLATELGDNVWAWVAVGVLTLLAAGAAMWARRGEEPSGRVVQNSVTGTVHGSVIQTGDITGPLNLGGSGDRTH